MTACRDRHGCWGTVELMRSSDDPPFGEDDAELLAGVAPLLGTLLRRSLAESAGSHEPQRPLPPATLILDGEHRPVSWTPAFRDWLRELVGEGEILPAAVYELCARLAAPPGLPPRVRLRTRTGRWAAIEGAPLEGGGTGDTAIIVRDASLDEIFDMLARTYDLSRRERELVALVVDGNDTRQVADALCISPHTVQDHLKAVFAKTRVRSRRELASHLSGR
jgi:DNA-binding CsgD family transcriptional regulator